MSEPQLHIETFVSPLFEENGYLVYRRPAGPCWIVDPSFAPQPQELLDAAHRVDLRIESIVLTHGHGDHIAGVDAIRAAAPEARLLIAEAARPALTDPNENLSAGLGAPLRVAAQPDGDLVPGEVLTLDGLTWTLLETSGHSPGGRSLYCAQAGVVLVGDALFAGSIGRHDFHHSDGAMLLRNIREHLFRLPDDTKVYSGHGPVTTIGHEKRTNPFVGMSAPA